MNHLAVKKNEAKKDPVSVRVSTTTYTKAALLDKFLKLSSANRVWGKDEKLLKCNLLLVPTSKNYTVLLALGRKNNGLR